MAGIVAHSSNTTPQQQNLSSGNLRSITEIPLPYRNLFNEYISFNSIQSEVIEDVFHSDKSIVVSAPTGSGKTVIFELAIVRLLMQYHHHHHQYQQQWQQQQHSQELHKEKNQFKIIYIAPIKALCSEKYSEWRKKFHQFNNLINCLEVTGDNGDIIDMKNLNLANFIITTPEKWDSLTRKWKDNENFVKSIKLFMIDEVHLLNEDIRGAILEAIVSRMKTIQYSMEMKNHKNFKSNRNDLKLRFIAVSATIPNIEDLALWLGGKNNSVCYHKISDDQRPVKLQKHVLGFSVNLTGFKFDMNLNYKLSGVIRRYSEGKPTLVFCNSRKSAEMATSVLIKDFPFVSLCDNKKAILKTISRRVQDTKLRDYVQKGIAYHHAGLSLDDRNNIEAAFRRSLIMVLISTNTLAMGVNLPAHLVIIKSTETYNRNSYVEYSESSLLQMIGRAGRPQYDENGVAVIMTHQRNVKKYENLVNGCEPIESHLHKHLAEHLNSEIVLQTITDLELAMEWIRSTFLYVRAVKCPMNYGFTCAMTKENVEKKLEEMCLEQINALESNGLIIKNQAFGLSITATPFGRLMARYYISFETMKIFRTIRGNESLLEMLNLIVRCKEFSEFVIRVNDKKILNELNDKPIRFPVRGKVKNNENKISCLIQSIFGNITIPDVSLMQDALRMVRAGERVSKCLSEYIRLSEKQSKNGIYKSLLNSLILSKCFRAKLWENSEFICKQLKKIGQVYSNLLVKAGKSTVESLRNTDPRTLEMILNKAPPFGNEILEALNDFPDYILEVKPKKADIIEIEVQQNNDKYKSNGTNCIILVGDTENNTILFSDKVDHEISESGIFQRKLTIPNLKTHAVHVHLIHNTLVGVDRTASVILNLADESNDRKTQKKNKKETQSKLKVTRSKKSSKSTSNPTQKATNNEKDDYSSLLLDDDDDDLKELDDSVLLLNDYPDNEIFNDGISEIAKEGSSKNSSSQISQKNDDMKRKLEDFQYVTKPKIKKTSTENDHNEEFVAVDQWNDDEFLINECDKENFVKSQRNNVTTVSSDSGIVMTENFERALGNKSNDILDVRTEPAPKIRTLSQYFKSVKSIVGSNNSSKFVGCREAESSIIQNFQTANVMKANVNQMNPYQPLEMANSKKQNSTVSNIQYPNDKVYSSVKHKRKNTDEERLNNTPTQVSRSSTMTSVECNRNFNIFKKPKIFNDANNIVLDFTKDKDEIDEIIDLSQKRNVNDGKGSFSKETGSDFNVLENNQSDPLDLSKKSLKSIAPQTRTDFHSFVNSRNFVNQFPQKSFYSSPVEIKCPKNVEGIRANKIHNEPSDFNKLSEIKESESSFVNSINNFKFNGSNSNFNRRLNESNCLENHNETIKSYETKIVSKAVPHQTSFGRLNQSFDEKLLNPRNYLEINENGKSNICDMRNVFLKPKRLGLGLRRTNANEEMTKIKSIEKTVQSFSDNRILDTFGRFVSAKSIYEINKNRNPNQFVKKNSNLCQNKEHETKPSIGKKSFDNMTNNFFQLDKNDEQKFFISESLVEENSRNSNQSVLKTVSVTNKVLEHEENLDKMENKNSDRDEILSTQKQERNSPCKLSTLYGVLKKFNRNKENLVNILESLCDKKLSENYRRCNLQNAIENLSATFDFDSGSLSPENPIKVEFLKENMEDKRLQNFKMHNFKVQNPLQIVRIPNLNFNNQTPAMKSESKQFLPQIISTESGFNRNNNRNEDKNYFKIPSNINHSKLFDYDNPYKIDNKYSPYRLQLHQRQKYFTIPKYQTKTMSESNSEELQRNIALESLKMKFKNDSTYNEESFMKDYTKYLLADTTNLKQCSYEDDLKIKVENDGENLNRTYQKEFFEHNRTVDVQNSCKSFDLGNENEFSFVENKFFNDNSNIHLEGTFIKSPCRSELSSTIYYDEDVPSNQFVEYEENYDRYSKITFSPNESEMLNESLHTDEDSFLSQMDDDNEVEYKSNLSNDNFPQNETQILNRTFTNAEDKKSIYSSKDDISDILSKGELSYLENQNYICSFNGLLSQNLNFTQNYSENKKIEDYDFLF